MRDNQHNVGHIQNPIITSMKPAHNQFIFFQSLSINVLFGFYKSVIRILQLLIEYLYTQYTDCPRRNDTAL